MARSRKNVLVAKQVVELTGSKDEESQSKPPRSAHAQNKTITSFFQPQRQARTSKSETTQFKVKNAIKQELSKVPRHKTFISLEPREVLDRIDISKLQLSEDMKAQYTYYPAPTLTSLTTMILHGSGNTPQKARRMAVLARGRGKKLPSVYMSDSSDYDEKDEPASEEEEEEEEEEDLHQESDVDNFQDVMQDISSGASILAVSDDESIKSESTRASSKTSSSSKGQATVKSKGTPSTKRKHNTDVKHKIAKPSPFDNLLESKLPPIFKIGDMFADLVSRAPRLEKTAKHVSGRKLRVATMCSGTESPLLALGMITEALEAHTGTKLLVEHVFSCEIEPFKQSYIERNFKPPLLFRDICELGNEYATTAYGAPRKVPGNVDMLIAGTSCVDYSSLNNKQKTIDDIGESGNTFRGMMAWVDNNRPSVVILENVCSAPWKRVVEDFESRGYCAAFTKFDSKRYYIPHTRTRGYLVAINTKPGDRLAADWVEMVKSLERPASSPFEAFMLNSDDPRIHLARQELSKGKGEDSRSGRTEWTRCELRHAFARAAEGLGHLRPFTNWDESGRTRLADFAWADWGGQQVERIHDLTDISYLRAAKQNIDPSYKTQLWNLSQNVDRNTASTKPGICPCLTPTIVPYITNRGGPMVGLEALSMQGLPIEQLLLTRESEAQLADLAGNAMTTTVVGTAMLCALIVAKNVFKKGPGGVIEEGEKDDIEAHVGGLDNLHQHDLDLSTVENVALNLLLKNAMRSARLCACEGRMGMTKGNMLVCVDCMQTSCEQCARHPIHNYIPLSTVDRLAPEQFDNGLKKGVPMRLHIKGLTKKVLLDIKVKSGLTIDDQIWTAWLEGVCYALDKEFRFRSVKRAEIWTVTYEAENARLELLLDPQQPEWRIFALSAASEPANALVRNLLRNPFARMKLVDKPLEGSWDICLPVSTTVPITIHGAGEKEDSWEKSLGIEDEKFNSKMVWRTLEITAENSTAFDRPIDGTYELFSKCGTANSGLHKRNTSGQPPLYFFLDPSTCGDGSTDSFVFALSKRRYNYGEIRPIIAAINHKWRQHDKTGAIEHTTCTVNGRWVPISAVKLVPGTSNEEQAYVCIATELKIPSYDSCGTALAILACQVPLNDHTESIWSKKWVQVDAVHERETFETLAWLTERVRTANHLSKWTTIDRPHDHANCERCAPTQPDLEWKLIKTKYVPFEDREQAGPYERSLKSRPGMFVTILKEENGVGHVRIGLDVCTMAHRAEARLPNEERHESVDISWRLTTSYIPPLRVVFPKFELQSNKMGAPANQPPHFIINLRPEQLKSLKWMMGQESDMAKPFIEEEIVEAHLPHMGWRSEAKAERPHLVYGGVLADEVGYGKTAIMLGLIASTQDQWSAPKLEKACIPVKATLIVVPSQLGKQWEAECNKFVGTRFKTILLQSVGDLNKLTINDVITCDVILVSAGLLAGEKYLENSSNWAGFSNRPGGNSDRLFKAWHKRVSEKMMDTLSLLRVAGSAAAYEHICSKAKGIENGDEPSYVQPKRLKGQQYVEAQKASGKDKKPKAQAKTGGKRKKEELSDEDDFLENDYWDREPAGKKQKPKNAIKARYREDPWGLQTAAVKGDWKRMKAPPLDIFHFNRLVVDEFTYVKGDIHIGVAAIKSSSRWVLSGTPPLENFASVKLISEFLRIHLGIDEVSGAKKADKDLIKDYTAVERFQMFDQTLTPSWHLHRHGVAQRFLDQFVRQNKAEIDEIKWKETFIRIDLPAAERALYLELQHHCDAQEGQIKKPRGAKVKSDREQRLVDALGESNSTDEALLKRCAHFDLGLHIGADDAFAACKIIVQERDDQLRSCQKEILNKLRECFLILPKVHMPPGERHHFQVMLDNAKEKGLADPDATSMFLDMVEKARKTPKKWHEDPAIVAMREEDEKKGKGKGRKGKIDDEEGNDENVGEKVEAVATPAMLLRTKNHDFTRLNKELFGRVRSLRFFKLVRDIQQFSASEPGLNDPLQFDPDVDEFTVCIKCKKTLALDTASILSTCGHMACGACLKMGQCPYNGCKTSAQQDRVIKATDLGAEDPIRRGVHFGKKLEQVIELISEQIPKKDKVLLFVQFKDLMDKVSQALDAHGILHGKIEGSAAQKSRALDKFQKGGQKVGSGEKVLLLNVMDESASGCNLTIANHVIFLSPLLATTQYEYDSAETQAIGRARRYGQTKTVHIYRFLTKSSIDTDIFEKRNGGQTMDMLAPGDGF